MILATLVSKSQSVNIALWAHYTDTIVEHLIKILIIDTQLSTTINTWQNEIKNHLDKINKDNHKLKPSQVFYNSVKINMLQDYDDIKDYTTSAVDKYLKDKSNLKHKAMIRECSIVEITDTVNELLYIIIDMCADKKSTKILDNKNINKLVQLFWNIHNLTYSIKSIKELKSIIK